MTSGDFDPRRLRRQFARDRLIWWTLLGAILLFILSADVRLPDAAMAGHIVFFVLLGLWLWANFTGARVVQQVPAITAAIESQPERAAAMAQAALRRWPLQRAVRATLYHRLASAWHRMGRFADTSLICHAILGQPLGQTGAAMRASVLLLMAECRMQCGDVMGTYVALTEAAGLRLNTFELLQKTALQIRYEVMIGQDVAALHELGAKLDFIELMPAPQAGSLHALLALAARRSGRVELADWLNARAHLLCAPEHLHAMGLAA